MSGKPSFQQNRVPVVHVRVAGETRKPTKRSQRHVKKYDVLEDGWNECDCDDRDLSFGLDAFSSALLPRIMLQFLTYLKYLYRDFIHKHFDVPQSFFLNQLLQ